ncbi:MAG: hypothetical protein H0V29_11910, partial [Thermoleophilaceae bacterium]|nr:hypothetical protein [Thermoleophilaceae bacterium]
MAVAVAGLACSPGGSEAVAGATICSAAAARITSRSYALVAAVLAVALGAGAFGMARLDAIGAPGKRVPAAGELRARAIQLEPARTVRFGTRA